MFISNTSLAVSLNEKLQLDVYAGSEHTTEVGPKKCRSRKQSSDTSMAFTKPEVAQTATIAPRSTVSSKKLVDLEAMAFSQGGHLMSNEKCKLPDGVSIAPRWATRRSVSAPKRKLIFPLGLTHLAHLLRPQAHSCPEQALRHRLRNGRTFVTLRFYYSWQGLSSLFIYSFDSSTLQTNTVLTWSRRWLAIYIEAEHCGVKVGELKETSKRQIVETQIIVTTREKYDDVTRKSANTSYFDLVRLIIVDEIHFLCGERSPVP